jgi:RNA polymerase sigma-70 factor (ECF subfamily)
LSPLTTDREQRLLGDLRAGKRRAFDRLYREYHGSIYNLCARVLGDREEAKDVTHDVFLKAIRQLPDAGEDLPLRPWLYRVATNTCFDALRRRRTRGDDPLAVERAAAPIDEYERAHDAALIEQTLAGLNERYRTALVLRDLHGLQPLEIAAVLDVPRGTADVVVHRAREAFQKGFAALAGAEATAPANLGLVLAPIAVPAVLQAAPLWPAVAPHVPPSLPLAGGPEAAVGPAGAGLLAKLGASLGASAGAKVAAAVAAATLAMGGGLAVDKLADRDAAKAAPPPHASSPHDAHASAKTSHEAHAAVSPHHDARWDVHEGIAGHTADAHDDGTVHDGTTTDGTTHDGTTHDATTTDGTTHDTTTDGSTHTEP